MRIERYEVGGREVPVETWGSSPDSLVFLGGLGVRPVYYRPGLELLSRRFRVWVPDLSFRTHRSLPSSPDEYLDLVGALARDMAPRATWVGHSFGGLLALMRRGPAIACAPSVPAEVPLSRMFGRAVWMQLREYAGLEGRIGVTYAGRIMVDYVRTAAFRPTLLFPAISALRSPPEAFPPVSREAIVYLCVKDDLYRDGEYRAYFDGPAGAGLEVVPLDDGHDWPITRPARLLDRVTEAFERLRGRAEERPATRGVRTPPPIA